MKNAAFLLFAVGLLTIYFVSQSVEPVPLLLGQLEENAGRVVKVEGEVVSIASGQHSFIELDDGISRGKIIFFNREVPSSEGDWLCVVGKVSLYKGEVEVIGEELC